MHNKWLASIAPKSPAHWAKLRMLAGTSDCLKTIAFWDKIMLESIREILFLLDWGFKTDCRYAHGLRDTIKKM